MTLPYRPDQIIDKRVSELLDRKQKLRIQEAVRGHGLDSEGAGSLEPTLPNLKFDDDEFFPMKNPGQISAS